MTGDAGRLGAAAASPLSDEEAFRGVFEHYAPRLRAFFLRRGAAAPTCDELTQEVMLVVWNKRSAFDPERGSLATWIFAIARNKHLDSLRRARPEPDPGDPLFQEHPADAPLPDSAATARQRQARLAKSVTSLPNELRDVLFSLYYEGKTMSEVSEETGVPLGTIKTRARRALAALKSALAEEET